MNGQKGKWDRWRCSSAGRTLAQHTQGPGFDPQQCLNQVEWSKPTIPAQEKQRQAGPKVKVILGYLITTAYGIKGLCNSIKNQ